MTEKDKRRLLYLNRGFWQKKINQFWRTSKHKQEMYEHIARRNPELPNSIISKQQNNE